MSSSDTSSVTGLDVLLTPADLAALRSSLALSPAQRFANLVAMNRFHAQVEERLLSPELRAALRARDIDDARRFLEEVERDLGPDEASLSRYP